MTDPYGRFEFVMVIRPRHSWRGKLAWPFLHFAHWLSGGYG